jgi:mRNA-degrading endonuclease RelE of RelBE toxin-antitoxin system
MTYSLFILRRAQKELADLPWESYERVRQESSDSPKIQGPPAARS